ncbi:hypothetical protein [Nonomuraea polychroma]|nr:hypothetical protein [Nonomuraea polychroma]
MAPAGWGEAAARQLDAALLSVGFKCSATLLERRTRGCTRLGRSTN